MSLFCMTLGAAALLPAQRGPEDVGAKGRLFGQAFERSLEKSRLHGTAAGTRLREWSRQFVELTESGRLEEAAPAGAALNRAVLDRECTKVVASWLALRAAFNGAAARAGVAPLPEMTAVTFLPATSKTVSHDEVRKAMERLEPAVKGAAAEHAWYAALAAESGRLSEEFAGREPAMFQQALENTLIAAEAVNRLEGKRAEWRAVREDLNLLAIMFGYPLLADSERQADLISVQRRSRRR
ncbi:MAG: hypothetical protein SFV54_20520 [Bryobacteraceae bacterium]|nr:hypothetical protein [Bryobacteraceae bacterium]